MARLPRYALPGMAQHVIQRGNNRSVVFRSNADYRFFRNCLREACAQHECVVHVYVLMPNHVHMLMTPATGSAIGKVMQSVGRRYVRRFNDAHGRTGTLWEGRYKATPVGTERHLWACQRYIELNPVRAGLVDAPAAYRWSSHRANAFGTPNALVTPHESYQALGSEPRARQAAYRTFFDEDLSDSTLAAIRDSTNGGWALGSQEFHDEIGALLTRRSRPATRGRRPQRNDEI